MRALVFENALPRLVATKLLSTLTPRAFVGPLAPMQLREMAEPALPAPDWRCCARACAACAAATTSRSS